MIDDLLARATTRFIFVVGKGGVGKTTTAGALALALADRNKTIHLISTDPAHSVGDLFQQDLAGGAPTQSACTDQLTLEEFNARAYADKFFAELRGPLIELMERGTYLDTKDAASFLDLSIPGIDEVMSALRLVELLDSSAAHIIVDTAPTGHAIRLLDSAGVIDSWVDAGRAMVEKASAVSQALVGGRVIMQAEPYLDEWHESVRRFHEQVLAAGSAMVVTRPGHVVAAETDRLIAQLDERKIEVSAIVQVGGDQNPSASASASASAGASVVRVFVDTGAPAIGCERLRAWGQPAKSTVPAPAQHPHTHTHSHSGLNWITSIDTKLMWVAGKGGVGKSTCASALAAALAETKKVCIISTDPAGSLSEVLDREVGKDVVAIEPNFFARQIDAISEFERMRDQYRSSVNQVFESLGLEGSAQLDRRVLEALWDFAPPGIDEIISLIEILEHAPDYDLLVIDSAPTGHFLRLIQMPEIALDWVHSLLRLVVKYGAIASLDALAQDLLAFAKRLRQLKLDLSTTGTTAVFLVTLAEPMVMAETARLISNLEHAEVPVAATILNRADDGLGAQAITRSSPRSIRAPDQHREVVGPSALRSFIAQWELYGE